MHYELDSFGENGYLKLDHHYNFSYPSHFHRSLEFIYVNHGSIYVIVQQQKIKLNQGESVLFLPNEIHGYESIGESYYWSIVFSPDLVPDFMTAMAGKHAVQPKFRLAETYLTELSEIKHLLKSTFKSQALLLIICSNYLEQVEFAKRPIPNDHLLYQIIEYIGRNYRENIDLKSLASALGYDHFYLSRFISANMQTTFHKYLTALRLAYAVELLTSTNEKMVEIAHQAGFPTIRTFNSAFKKAYGIPPREFRKQKTRQQLS